MRTRLFIAALVLVSSVNVFGQDGQNPPAQDREQRPRRMGRGMNRINPRIMKEELASTLQLDDAQQVEVDRILNDHQKKLDDIRNQLRPSDEMMDQMTRIRDELRVARENKDQAKIDQLLVEIREVRKVDEERKLPMRKAQEEARQALKTDLMAILRGDQKLKFETYWTEKMEPRRERYEGPARTPQALKAMVDRLPGISSDQKSQLDTIFKQFHEAQQAAPPEGEVRDALVKKLYDDVLNLLTPDQRGEIERKLAGNRRPREAREPQSRTPRPPPDVGG